MRLPWTCVSRLIQCSLSIHNLILTLFHEVKSQTKHFHSLAEIKRKHETEVRGNVWENLNTKLISVVQRRKHAWIESSVRDDMQKWHSSCPSVKIVHKNSTLKYQRFLFESSLFSKVKYNRGAGGKNQTNLKQCQQGQKSQLHLVKCFVSRQHSSYSNTKLPKFNSASKIQIKSVPYYTTTYYKGIILSHYEFLF